MLTPYYKRAAKSVYLHKFDCVCIRTYMSVCTYVYICMYLYTVIGLCSITEKQLTAHCHNHNCGACHALASRRQAN